MKSSKAIIPTYDLEHFKHTHREKTDSIFGYNNLDKSLFIKGFELYSSEGLAGSVGPLKSAFYRMSLTVRGTLDMLIGLDNFKHQPGTISVTYPNQVFAKNNISSDAFGYYMLFSSDFLNGLVPSVKLAEEFPFFEASGTPLFRLAEDEMVNIINLISKIDDELKRNAMDKVKAVKMYLYLTLLEVKRSYERQQLVRF